METVENISFDYNFDLNFDFNSSYANVDYGYIRPTFSIFYLLVFAVGLIANAIVLYVVLRFRKMWTTTNIYIFSLALGDLFDMLNLLFFTIEIVSYYWSLRTFMCKLFWTFTTITNFSSIYILTVMTASVFVQLYFPSFSKKSMGPKSALLISLFVWIICLLLGIPTFIYGGLDDVNQCRILWPNPLAFWTLVFLSCRLAFAFLIPLMLIAILLILMVVRARKQEKASEMDFGSIKENMVMIMVLGLVYTVFWLPIHVLEIVSSTISNPEIDEVVYYIISLIPYLKSCLYPFLYGLLSQSFKTALKQAFCCCKKTHTVNGTHQNSTEGREEKSEI